MIGDHFYTTSADERDHAILANGYSSEGVACKIFANARLPLTGDHFYTTAPSEANGAVSNLGYISEGVACYVLPTGVSSTNAVPLYNLFNPKIYDSFYTTSVIERDSASGYGYLSGSIACFVFSSQVAGTVPLFRLRSLRSGDHFYTTSAQERDNAILIHGYISEDIQCYVFSGPGSGRVPLLRLMRAVDPSSTVPLFRLIGGNGDHFYTTSLVERQSAIDQFGYRSEGVAGHVLRGDLLGWPWVLYRLRSLETGDHFYTMSKVEHDGAVANFNYVSEGVAAFVVDPSVQSEGLTAFYRLLKVAEPQIAPVGGLTCDGKAETAATQTFVFAAQHSVTKAIYSYIWSVRANSANDAQSCAQRLVNQALRGAIAVRLDSLRTFYFAMYSPGACTPTQTVNTSSNDAKTYLLASLCANCTFVDISASVTNPDGSLDLGRFDGWCDLHPTP